MNDNVITPLEGEVEIPGVAPAKVGSDTAKRLVAVAIFAVSILGAIGYAAAKHFSTSADIPEKAAASPDVASAQEQRLNMPILPAASGPAQAATQASGAGAGARGQAVPGIVPLPGEAIGVQGTGGFATSNGGNPPPGSAPPVKVMNPDDAPIFSSGAVPDMHAPATVAPRSSGNRVADAHASLDAYQRQLAGVLENLQNLTSGKPGSGSGAGPGAVPGASSFTPSPLPATGSSANQQAAVPSLFGSLDRSATPSVQARMLGDRNMIVPKGTLFLCSLKTRVISATSGFIGCQVTRNVFSDNGLVLLIERGSHMDGEYRIVSIKPGVTRIPVLWTRMRTPQGVTIDLESPATGALGESGLGGYVDNRWGERLGAAVMLSLVNDALKYAIASQNSNGSGNTVLLPNTTDQGSKLAEKVLETTINIPPLLYENQGGVVGVYVSRDLDFSSVYELRPQ
ncbi:MAG: type IV secretion system protein VirB10 [Pseudomonadota bacterium]|nr:type IV secretion system protein VirB10 [Pseudomonadota bacterium]